MYQNIRLKTLDIEKTFFLVRIEKRTDGLYSVVQDASFEFFFFSFTTLTSILLLQKVLK